MTWIIENIFYLPVLLSVIIGYVKFTNDELTLGTLLFIFGVLGLIYIQISHIRNSGQNGK